MGCIYKHSKNWSMPHQITLKTWTSSKKQERIALKNKRIKQVARTYALTKEVFYETV